MAAQAIVIGSLLMLLLVVAWNLAVAFRFVVNSIVNRTTSKPHGPNSVGMRKYIVTGASSESGEDISFEVNAWDPKDAEERAFGQGVLVTRVQVAGDPYPIEGGPEPESAPRPSPPQSPPLAKASVPPSPLLPPPPHPASFLLRRRPGSSQTPPSRPPGGGICAGNALPLYLGARLTQRLWP